MLYRCLALGIKVLREILAPSSTLIVNLL